MTWGVVSTIKADLKTILNFAAWHLELGAHRLFIYLDDDPSDAFDILKAHPRIRPTVTNADYWDKHGSRPRKHQVRQVRNATRAYRRQADVDWLCHIDVDEFLMPEGTVDAVLSSCPAQVLTLRMRPMEALARDDGYPNHFKRLTLDRTARRDLSARIWPTYGSYLDGGFLSHVAGKLMVRTGLPDLDFKIHNVTAGGQENPGAAEAPALPLAHLHAKSWEDWLTQYRYRHDKGSYRSELKPAQSGRLTLHDLFTTIEADGGEIALREFFMEVCADTPDHRARLSAHNLLHQASLPLDAIRERHFPGAIDRR
ncbi:glycosyltransferase family 2 protein [Pseudooceanicola nitratireducens]|uniref:glycosyltransferase family 2 protein n=1 Tax=Pseudooceanicola nitratireducens TaxID=517719 RepID=UPI003C7E5339